MNFCDIPTRSDTNRPLQSQRKGRILKFWLEVEEELYYMSSKNKGADQLCSYCTADLCFCFRIGKNLVFSLRGSFTGYRNKRFMHSTFANLQVSSFSIC